MTPRTKAVLLIAAATLTISFGLAFAVGTWWPVSLLAVSGLPISRVSRRLPLKPRSKREPVAVFSALLALTALGLIALSLAR